ncbi:MAG: hypothetical protein AB1606_04640 [Nitrospirota bacterium]
MNQFLSEIPFGLAKEILRHYRGQPLQRVITSAKTRLLPKAMRITRYIRYMRFRDIADKYGIESSICSCKNPDLPWEPCNPWVNEKELYQKSGQVSLFV